MSTIAVVLRTNYQKTDGSYPVNLRLSIGKKSKLYSLNVSAAPVQWDSIKQRVNSKHSSSFQANLIIHNAVNAADKILLEHDKLNKNLTFNLFEALFYPKAEENTDVSYFDFVTEQMKLRKKSVSFGHDRQCFYELTKLKNFRKDFKISEINYRFLQEYEQYMRETLNNKTNTVKKTFTKLRTFLNIALKSGIIQKNPFENYKLKSEPTNRKYLTEEELEVLEKIYTGKFDKKLKNVLQYFLFACYTGLRYADLFDLTYSNIKDNRIILTMHKTKEQIIIPLIDKAKKLIPECTFHEQKVFKVITNQKCNDYLKLIMLATEINKNISFHCSRHTFATVSITLGIPIEVVCKLLGHNDLKTTQIYAKIVDSKKFTEMEKWNK